MASHPHSSEQASQVLQYRIGRRIRFDLDGELFEAFDTSLSRAVWIRRFPLKSRLETHSSTEYEGIVEELRARIRKVAALQHPSFVRIHNVEELDDCMYVVMEAVNGRALPYIDGESTAIESQMMRYLFDVATALREAHVAGLVHGDLKADNLLIDASGHVRILNFSLMPGTPSQIFGSENQIDPFGSLATTAPERFSSPLPQAASDLYSLGVTWYACLSGQLPFPTLSGLALVAAHLQQNSAQWPWPERMSASVKAILLKLTDTNPALRPTSHDLRDLCLPLIPVEMLSQSLSRDDLRQLRIQLLSQKSDKQHEDQRGDSGIVQARPFLRQALSLGLLTLALIFIGWQASRYWPQVVTALSPYSSQRELQLGVDKLTDYQIRPQAALLNSAIQHFQVVLDHEPQNAEAVAYMAMSNLSKYNASTRDEIWFQKAKAGAQQAMMLAPQAASSLLAQAKIQQGHHQLDAALASVEQVLQKEPNQLLAWHCKMSILLEAGRREEALSFGQRGANKFLQDRYLLDLVAGIYLAQYKYEQAKQALETSIQRQPESLLAYSLLANVLYLQENRDEALNVIQKGLVIGPHVSLYGTLGNIRFQDGDFAAAADAYRNAVSVDKGVNGSYLRWFQYSEALVQLKERQAEARQAHQKSRELLELRLQRSPDDPILTSILAVIEARLGNADAAHKQIRQTLALANLTGESYFWIALTYQILGEQTQALTALRDSRRLQYDQQMIERYPDLKRVAANL